MKNILIAFFILVGCSSDRGTPFKSEQELTSYIAHLQLEALSIESAAVRLETEGFACSKHSDAEKNVLCERKASSVACDQTQRVKMKLSDAGATSVLPQLWLKCL